MPQKRMRSFGAVTSGMVRLRAAAISDRLGLQCAFDESISRIVLGSETWEQSARNEQPNLSGAWPHDDVLGSDRLYHLRIGKGVEKLIIRYWPSGSRFIEESAQSAETT